MLSVREWRHLSCVYSVDTIYFKNVWSDTDQSLVQSFNKGLFTGFINESRLHLLKNAILIYNRKNDWL